MFVCRRETERQRARETERQRDRETERQRDRETERQRDRETGRQRDRERRQRDRETERQRDLGAMWRCRVLCTLCFWASELLAAWLDLGSCRGCFCTPGVDFVSPGATF